MKSKKIYISFLSFLGIVLILFFGLKIFEIIYFNEKYYKVPDLKSYTLKEAQEIVKNSDIFIKDMGSELSSYPIGQIFMQEPNANKIVKKGRNIKIWVSRGQALVDVPNLSGMNYLDAKVVAEKVGLNIKNVIYIKSTGKYNEVLATDPATNTLLPRGQEISFLVNGLETTLNVSMPDVIGLNLAEARNIIFKHSLIVGNISYMKINNIEPGLVIKTSVNPATMINAGTSINLTISE